MKHPIIAVAQRLLVLGLALGASAPAVSGSTVPTDKYVAGQGARFESLAGSRENLVSLVNGLRTGTEIRLTEPAPVVTPPPPGSTPPPGTTPLPAPLDTTTFTPPTRPMGYGNITRSLDLASRQLASQGITDPTAAELKAALNGGTIQTATGEVRLDGVLQLRSQGMGWGKIAHTVGVHPGAKVPAHARVPAGAGTGVVTAAGSGRAVTSNHGPKPGRSGVVTAAGSSSVSPAASNRGHGHVAASAGIRTAAGGTSGGNGHAYGRAGK